uniref:Uncharacterized protein n=1 Tax=Kalanchoe fedtschenkoi TaxID=63787 RepID=A0A7N0VES7_KALFE
MDNEIGPVTNRSRFVPSDVMSVNTRASRNNFITLFTVRSQFVVVYLDHSLRIISARYFVIRAHGKIFLHLISGLHLRLMSPISDTRAAA